MKFQRKIFAFAAGLIFPVLCAAVLTFGQAGGDYDLSHNVIAGGGGSRSEGGVYTLDGTAGQALAGAIGTGNQHSLRSGFWASDALAPTAASVSIGGRVAGVQDGDVSRVRIRLLDASSGIERTALTNPFGHYRFDDVEIGRIYILRAESKKFTFAPEMHVFQLVDAREDIDFTAVETANADKPVSPDYSTNKNK